MQQLYSVFLTTSRVYMQWIAHFILRWIGKVGDALLQFVTNVLGPKRVQWLVKHFPRDHLYWFISFLPSNWYFWRNAIAITGTIAITWQSHALLAEKQKSTMHTRWNLTAEIPLERRLIYDNGLGHTPLMGWSGWNKYECKINEKIVRGNVEAMVRLDLPSYGYNFVIIDDCWAAYKRDKQGMLQSHKRTFPSGIKALADYAHERGMKFGLYSDAGYRTCIGHRAGSQGHELQDAMTFASWGVDYLKYDNCYHDGSDSHIRYPVMSKALNKTGRPIFYAICEWGEDNPAIWAPKYANSWRTSLDVKDRWKRISLLADDNNEWATYAGPGGWNDPDMLQVGNGRLSVAEYRSHFSIWSLAKAPLIIGCELRNIHQKHLEIYTNKEVIAVNQDPLGIQGRKVSQQGRCRCLEVWAGPLSGKRIAVVVWNRSMWKSSIRINWFDLGLEPDVSVQVRDLWKHEDWLEPIRNGFSVEVPSHDCNMYIFSHISSWT